MKKILIMPSSIEQTNIKCDGVIIGIKGLSINMPAYFEVKDLKQIKNKEIFVSLNKNMHNSDLDYLKDVLLELNNYNIKGVLFYDLSIVNLKKKLSLNYDLVWAQEHFTTNYITSNFWYEQGVKYTLISNNITLDEVKEFIDNSKTKLMLTVFGYIPIFVSKRNLVKNYLKTFKLDNKSKIYYLKNEDNLYPIINENETVIYSSYILNSLREIIDLEIDYIILNSFKIDNFEEVVNLFKTVNKSNIDEY